MRIPRKRFRNKKTKKNHERFANNLEFDILVYIVVVGCKIFGE